MAGPNESPETPRGGLAAKPAEMPAPTIRYIDRPDCAETFADSVTNVYFDGQSLRLEFCVTRLDEFKTGSPVTGRRYPAQRVALTPMGAVELINRLQQVVNALTQAGVLKTTPKTAAPTPASAAGPAAAAAKPATQS